MSKMQKSAISPTRAENYPEWYQQVIKAADLAEVSPVRGCMIIKPWGYGIWQQMQRILDERITALGHQNVYFPLLIPLSFLQKEADHVEGFAKECAVVTHSKLTTDAAGKLVPAGKLDEPYIIRPTSETIIGDAFSRWVQSYRDLPLLINQWANIVRWEMRTRLFLRTTEFLWQEGHTAHATEAEARTETLQMLDVYADFVENSLAIPVIKGEKTAAERFPGAEDTYCIEAMMQDKKALQAGTSHFLGQHFAKSFNIKFLSQAGQEELVWTTSWGVSTRMMGALIMVHSDDDGLIVPPKVAPIHVVILPILRKPEDKQQILDYCEHLTNTLRAQHYHHQPLKVQIDLRELTGGEKAWSWVKKGVPIRLEIGMQEVQADAVFMGRRDLGYKEKRQIPRADFLQEVTQELDALQANLFEKAQRFQQSHLHHITTKEDFYALFSKEGRGGFAMACWNGDPAIEAQLKKELSVTIRCIPFAAQTGTCIFTGDSNAKQVAFAQAY